MSSPGIIEAFLFDDENEGNMLAHGLSVRQVFEVLGNPHVVLKNRKKRRGFYLIIGRDNGGTCIAAPVEKAAEPGVWRPITAWSCKPSETAALEREGC